ncbi:MAG: hypothetical protein CMG66_03280 [Candidatus Marinimicrobia bacterium]|nr:hypothetical protein [Candidatus Neomarinimicrobiota bacterium]|tara:strand:+ start:30342 stop:30815 length:474 start_codon:yes stop_codon:yes gene_type:complete
MNLREKFIWNMIVLCCISALLWNTWGQFNKHTEIDKAYDKFINEEVGTDKELQNMVSSLEENLNIRQNLKFKPKENPLDLTRVVVLDGDISARGVKGIECSGIITDKDGSLETICTYRSKRYVVAIGDSIGGGIVSDISSNKVHIKKDKENIILEIY